MYRIKDWALHFENAESRKIKGARWLPMPNKHDGKGFRRMSRHAEKVSIFCAWTLILQVASKCPVRGDLADENGPLTAIDLADSTGFPEEIFALAFETLMDPKIGWIVEIPWPVPEELRIPPAAQDKPAVPPDETANSPGASGRPTNETGNPGNEGKGTEGNRTEQKEDPPPSSRAKVPPHDPAVTAILREYPKTREREGGRKEAVHVGEGDRGKIADFINANPDYPLLESVKHYAKWTTRPKNLREWLLNPTAREIVLKALAAEKQRDSPAAPEAGPIGPTEEDRRKAREMVESLERGETGRAKNVRT